MLSNKLHRWQKAGIISEEKASEILNFERQHYKPIFLHAIIGIACLLIIIGLVSVTAANFHKIPASIKLLADVIILTLLGSGIYYFYQKKKFLISDILITIMFGMVLVSIALIGQIYNSNMPLVYGMSFWIVSTLSLVLLVKLSFFPNFWIFSLFCTMIALYNFKPFLNYFETNLPLTGFVLIPSFFFLAIASIGYLKKKNPNFYTASFTIGMMFFVFNISLLIISCRYSYYIYNNLLKNIKAYDIGLTVLCCSTFALIAKNLLTNLNKRQLNSVRLLFLSCIPIILLSISSWIPKEWLSFTSATLFLVFWSILAYNFAVLDLPKLFMFAIFVIVLRIYVIYLEIFGSMLQTGLGMIASGILLLGFIYVWIKYRYLLLKLFGVKKS